MATVSFQKPKVSGDGDNVYVNLRVKGGEGEPYRNSAGLNVGTLAKYKATRVAPFLENPSEYALSIARFNLDGFSIPIMVWGTTPYNPLDNPSSKVDKYKVTMSFNGTDVTKNLIYIPDASQDTDIYGPSIWNYREFLNILNKAFLDAFTDLKALEPTAPPTIPPYVELDGRNELFTFFAPTDYDTGTAADPAPAPTIQVYFNTELFLLFQSVLYFGFTQDPATPKNFQLLFRNQKNNTVNLSGTDYYKMRGEFSTLWSFNDYQRIVFQTDSIPVRPEFLPFEGGGNGGVKFEVGQADVGSHGTSNLLTDFLISPNTNIRDAFQYNARGWKRFTDLRSEYPLREIDVQAFWQDVQGKLYPIVVGEEKEFSMKILFKRKDTINYREIDDNY